MENRIACSKLREKIMTADQAAEMIKTEMLVAFGGYTSSGYPKKIARALTKKHIKEKDFKIRMLTGANTGPLDTILGEADLVSWRAPMIESKVMSNLVNCGEVHYVEQQMNRMPQMIEEEWFGKIDFAVIEAISILENGEIVPTSSVGMVPHFLEKAEKIIVEINTVQPEVFEGMHDIYLPLQHQNEPIPLTQISQRIGQPFLSVDTDKIVAIVESDELDQAVSVGENKPQICKIAQNLLSFLRKEAQNFPDGKIPALQTGFGNLATEIARELARSEFKDLSFFCGGITEAVLELIVLGKVKAISTGSIQMTPRAVQLLKEQPELFRDKIVIRNTDITNRAETIGRMGIIALTSGIEMDIYGNVNSSHIAGIKVVNGLGGGANFAENAALSILLIPAESKNGAISAIVPMVSHQDICEHDIDVVITENGVADLRGKDDLQRATEIIENCAGPHYKEQLKEYLIRAKQQVGGHHPQILEEAFSWHIRLQQTGTMQEFCEEEI
ncbi:acetyl-CoA hydrolase/transferase C-terminal domain-containing protein [Anaerotignum sp.]|uniref:acetyl-CoA hydrolase/transferase C-terminal domain-containing protein n=1 Tax=Anaerotignum sp. TaxID=2039241 RepID=UPI0037366002